MGPDAMILVFWMLSFKTWSLEFARNSVIFMLELNISASSIGKSSIGSSIESLLYRRLSSLYRQLAMCPGRWPEPCWKSGWYPAVIVTTGISVLRRKVGLSVKIYQVISKRHTLVSLRETAVMGLGDSVQYCILEFLRNWPHRTCLFIQAKQQWQRAVCYIASNNNLLESMDGRIGLILMVVSTLPCIEL